MQPHISLGWLLASSLVFSCFRRNNVTAVHMSKVRLLCSSIRGVKFPLAKLAVLLSHFIFATKHSDMVFFYTHTNDVAL